MAEHHYLFYTINITNKSCFSSAPSAPSVTVLIINGLSRVQMGADKIYLHPSVLLLIA